jgi:hypothetical protein
MPRLLVHVEGQTEEFFVNEVLRDHLVHSGYSAVSARIVGNPIPRGRRGGIRAWQAVRKDILRHLREDAGAIATTMVDYYALPHDWPGRARASEENSTSGKAECVEAALREDIAERMGSSFDQRRFVPFVVMHEFEALLFSDPDQFARAIGRGDLTAELHRIRQTFLSPEEINDSPINAPSKRIERLIPGYEKVLSGIVAAVEIGLPTIRQQCSHFNDWLERLEAIPVFSIRG